MARRAGRLPRLAPPAPARLRGFPDTPGAARTGLRVAFGGAATAGAVSARRGPSRFPGHPRRGPDRPSGGVCGCGCRRRFDAGAPPLRVAVSVPVSTTAGHTAERRPASRFGHRGAPRVGPRAPSRPLRGFGISQTPRRARDRSSGGARGYGHRRGRLDAGAPPVGVSVSVPVTTDRWAHRRASAGRSLRPPRCSEGRPAGPVPRAPSRAPAAGRSLSNKILLSDQASVIDYGNAYGTGLGHRHGHRCPSLSRSPCPELQRWMHRRASAAGQARTPRCSGGQPAGNVARHFGGAVLSRTFVAIGATRAWSLTETDTATVTARVQARPPSPLRPHTRPRLGPQGGTVRFDRGATRAGGPAPCNSTPFGPSRKTRPVRVGQTRQHALHCPGYVRYRVAYRTRRSVVFSRSLVLSF